MNRSTLTPLFRTGSASNLLLLCGCLGLHALSLAPLQAEPNWPAWRGPHQDGRGAEGNYPAQWSEDQILWKATLPGKGCSTPAIWDQRLYLTAPVDGQDAVLAFDWSGRELWRTVLGPETAGKHRNGSGSNASPVTDGHGVFVYFKSGHLAALELDGRVRWTTNLVAQYGPDTLFWDHGTSPVLTKDLVIMARMHHGESWLAAFDKKSGAMRWKVARNYETPVEGDHAYTTPLLIQHQNREALLVWGAEHLTAHDVADGSLLWSCGDFNAEGKGYLPAVASAVLVGDIAVVPHGRADRGKARLHGIKLGGSGDVTDTHRLWKRDDGGAFVPTPAADQGRVYSVGDRGEVTCLDARTGQTVWTDAFPKAASSYYASPLVAADKLYAAREDGVIFVASVKNGFELLAENKMNERVIASPVALADRLFIRGEEHLFCITSTSSK